MNIVGGIALCVVGFFFIVWLLVQALFEFSVNPRWWYCDLLHKKYHTKFEELLHWGIKCSKCGRLEDESNYY